MQGESFADVTGPWGSGQSRKEVRGQQAAGDSNKYPGQLLQGPLCNHRNHVPLEFRCRRVVFPVAADTEVGEVTASGNGALALPARG